MRTNEDQLLAFDRGQNKLFLRWTVRPPGTAKPVLDPSDLALRLGAGLGVFPSGWLLARVNRAANGGL